MAEIAVLQCFVRNEREGAERAGFGSICNLRTQAKNPFCDYAWRLRFCDRDFNNTPRIGRASAFRSSDAVSVVVDCHAERYVLSHGWQTCENAHRCYGLNGMKTEDGFFQCPT